MRLSWLIMLFLVLHLLNPNSIFGQSDHELHKRSVIGKTETWKKGQIDDTRHVVDSFFYEDGALKEVTESMIKRVKFRVVDSVSVNQRKQWSRDGELMLVEHFDKNTGNIKKINSNYPPNKNLIRNGSFEQHTDIPCHKFSRYFFFPPATHNTIVSNIKKDTVHVIKDQNGTTLHILTTEETQSEDESNLGRQVLSYVFIETNGRITDSIFVRVLHKSHYGPQPTPFKHECNYDTAKVHVSGWNSVGRVYPKIFDFEKRAPWHPLQGLADSVFQFTPAEGNHFISLSGCSYYGVFCQSTYTCNPWMHHPLLQTPLNATLEKGKKYQLEFWLWKPKTYPIKQSLQVCFTKEPVTTKNFRASGMEAFKLPAFNDSVTHQWQKVFLIFEALEFARYMTIGFFNGSPTISKTDANKAPHFSPRCFVDGFILTEVESIEKAFPLFYTSEVDPLTVDNGQVEEPPIVFSNQQIEQNQPIILENIHFNYDSHVLLPESKNGLQKLISLMEAYPNIRIEIIGHTDNSGTEEYNQNLSEKRAEAVVLHLIEKGIPPQRLTWKGCGSKFPVSSNATENGSEQNRRVEFMYMQD
jgi:outer membrane protein OmpA-like peptidoglycan-associated protein